MALLRKVARSSATAQRRLRYLQSNGDEKLLIELYSNGKEMQRCAKRCQRQCMAKLSLAEQGHSEAALCKERNGKAMMAQ